jgi:hypothetical protein
MSALANECLSLRDEERSALVGRSLVFGQERKELNWEWRKLHCRLCYVAAVMNHKITFRVTNVRNLRYVDFIPLCVIFLHQEVA